MHIPASPGSFQVLDFTEKPCRTTLETTRTKVFMAFVFMGWRENQTILKLWLISSLASYCSHKPGLAARVYRHNPPETSQLQFLATNYYPIATQLQVTVLPSKPYSPSHTKDSVELKAALGVSHFASTQGKEQQVIHRTQLPTGLGHGRWIKWY